MSESVIISIENVSIHYCLKIFFKMYKAKEKGDRNIHLISLQLKRHFELLC